MSESISLTQFKPYFNKFSKAATARALKEANLTQLSEGHLRRSDWFTDLFQQCLASEQDELEETVKARTVEDLIADKCKSYESYTVKQDSNVKIVAAGNKPVAILHLGDPHLDDNGCDFPLLKHHIDLIKGREGVWCGNIGDTTNNWVGRLKALYAEQSTTFTEALELSEWLINSVHWLYFIHGNHDLWDNGSYILKLLMKNARIECSMGHEANVSLAFDNGVKVNILARHDFKGRSMWHPNHGLLKTALMRGWGDLLIAGHTHEHGLLDLEDQQGRPVKCLRVRGYKRHDSFAMEKGFYDHKYGAAALTVINPYAAVTDRIINFWDVELGLEYLDFLRSIN